MFSVFYSCASREEMEQLKDRVEQLERRMDELNSEIAGLRAIVLQLNSGGYVTAVIPDADGKGYTLAFNDGSSVHISLAGDSGQEPQIGVKQDEDGNWYWTVDGSWMLDSDGNKVAVSAPATGQPIVKIEGDIWYVSYDGGASWTELATRSSGGIYFQRVDTSNPDFVLLVLSDGTELRLPTWAAFDALREYVKQLNINLSSLASIVSALTENDYLVSVTPFVEDGAPVGWLLNFSKSGLVVIYSSGRTASPHIGVRQDTDGIYYWTLDGEWLLDAEGKKVRAQGTNGQDAAAPKLKIEGDYWYISYDEGVTWTLLGKATGENGDSFFREVDTTNDEYVLLVLADGSSLMVPKYVALDIVLDLPRDLVIEQYESLKIPFTIVGTHHEDVTVSVLVNGSLNANVDRLEGGDSGFIDISELGYDAGTLVVLLSTTGGTSVIKSVTFAYRDIRMGLDMYGILVDLHAGYSPFDVSSQGGYVELAYQSNTSFRIDTSEAPWMHVIQDFNGHSPGKLVFEVEKNGDLPRTGMLRISFDDPDWKGQRIYTPNYYIKVNQGVNSVVFGIPRAELSGVASLYEVSVSSAYSNLSASSMSDWMNVDLQKTAEGEYLLRLDIDDNDTDEPRYSAVNIMSGKDVIGILPVIQYHYDNRFNAMIMKVLALPGNNNDICLPFNGSLSLTVDWGDSVLSLYGQQEGAGHPARHHYSSPGEYIVKAYGSLKALSTREPDGSSIASLATVESVLQWGNGHIFDSMEYAFADIVTLKSLAPDNKNDLVFRSVTSFRGAFSGCINLEDVPSDIFDYAWNVTDFTDTFKGVSKVRGESPYTMINGNKMYLYDRDGSQTYNGMFNYCRVNSCSGCFSGGNWADQAAIHAAGWD